MINFRTILNQLRKVKFKKMSTVDELSKNRNKPIIIILGETKKKT